MHTDGSGLLLCTLHPVARVHRPMKGGHSMSHNAPALFNLCAAKYFSPELTRPSHTPLTYLSDAFDVWLSRGQAWVRPLSVRMSFVLPRDLYPGSEGLAPLLRSPCRRDVLYGNLLRSRGDY